MSPILPSEVERKVPNPDNQSVCREIVDGVFNIRKDVLAFIKYVLKAGDQLPDGTIPVDFSDQFKADLCAITCTTTSTTNSTTTPGTGTTTVTTITTSTTTTTTLPLIAIVDFAPARPYPSVRTYSALSGVITKVVISLTGLTHSSIKDVQMLLVAPDGTTCCKFMGAVGGERGVSGVNLLIDQTATALPANADIPSGTYGPMDYGPFADLPLPAPISPYSHDLSVFNGLSANGDWKLYVDDDRIADVGSLQNWSLTITTA